MQSLAENTKKKYIQNKKNINYKKTNISTKYNIEHSRSN